jgi:hypothetical protein
MLMNAPRLFERMKNDGLDAIVATAPETQIQLLGASQLAAGKCQLRSL